MNRNQEYIELLRALDRAPAELNHTVIRAKARADSRRQRLRWTGVPVGTLAGVLLAFVMLVNSNVAFAQTVAEVPVLSGLAAAVSCSDSLGAASESGVQAVGLTQTRNHVTITIDCAAVDPQHVDLFLTVEDPFPAPSTLYWRVLSRDPDWTADGSTSAAGRRAELHITFPPGYPAPGELTVALSKVPICSDTLEDLDPDRDFIFTVSLAPETPA